MQVWCTEWDRLLVPKTGRIPSWAHVMRDLLTIRNILSNKYIGQFIYFY